MAAHSSSFLYFLRKCSFSVPEGEALGVLIKLSSSIGSDSDGECDRLLIWLLTWLPNELGVSSAVNRRRFGSVGRSIRLSSLIELWLPYILRSSVDGEHSSLARCWRSWFSLIGDQVLRLISDRMTKIPWVTPDMISQIGMGNSALLVLTPKYPVCSLL